MTVQALTGMLISALALPVGCRVDQRVPKKMLVENGAPTSADKRLINDIVEEVQWIAALKSNTVGVAEYRDHEREYLEVAVLSITARHAAHSDGEGAAKSPPTQPVWPSWCTAPCHTRAVAAGRAAGRVPVPGAQALGPERGRQGGARR